MLKQLAAHYLKEKRSSLEIALSMSESASELDSSADSVAPSVYIGQFGRLLEQGDTVSKQPYVITLECVEHYCQLYHFFYLQINAFYFHLILQSYR